MIKGTNINDEQLSAAAFTKQSAVFDDIYAANTIVHYKRERIRNHVNKYLPANSNILELNSGTGDDAIYFAQRSHTIHATDISEGMLQELTRKVSGAHLESSITSEKCSFTELSTLQNKGPYNLIFSNFAGLNCTSQLRHVLLSFKSLLATDGLVTLVVLPKFCLWETLLMFKGKFKTAFRRFNAKNGAQAHIEGVHFKCWYYNPSFITDTLKKDFDILSIEGLCTFVPPSYMEHFAEKHPALYRLLKKAEHHVKDKWPWRQIGDYYIITLRKK